MRLLLTIIFSSFILIACSSNYAPAGLEFNESGQGYTQQVEKYRTHKSAPVDRSVITNARLQIETLVPDTVQAKVIGFATKYKGYVLNAVNTLVAIRIPSKNFEPCMEEIERLGKVVSRKITGQDVTDRYSDHKIRLDNAQKTRDRYLNLLERANTIQEVLLLEKELERLNREIELLKGKIQKLEHLVSYATITVDTSEQVKLGPVGHLFNGLYQGVKWLFVRD